MREVLSVMARQWGCSRVGETSTVVLAMVGWGDGPGLAGTAAHCGCAINDRLEFEDLFFLFVDRLINSENMLIGQFLGLLLSRVGSIFR